MLYLEVAAIFKVRTLKSVQTNSEAQTAAFLQPHHAT